MTRLALGRPRWQLGVAAALLILVVTPNVYLVGRSLGIILDGNPAVDWHHFVEAGRRVEAGVGLYDFSADYGYRYSPLLAHLFAVIAPMGDTAWRLFHLVAAFALPSWPMRLVTLAAWPFWFDVEAGNVMAFVVLAAAWALRGSAAGVAAFMAMAVLMPRPLMLPVLVWLLGRHRRWVIPFVGLVAIHTAAVAFTGWGDTWLGVLASSSNEVGSPLNLGPSRWIGLWWLAAGVPLAAWLTWRGHLGWASLAISPYWLPYYLLMPVLDLARKPGR